MAAVKYSSRNSWIKSYIEAVVQRFTITFQLFSQNGLANHAAAGAYGFLLSAAPALLIISFFVSRALQSSPETVVEIIKELDFINQAFNIDTLIESFVNTAHPGIPGVISVISVLWAARVFALSLLRGLKVVFSDSSNGYAMRNYVISFIIELGVIVIAIIILLSSRSAIQLYGAFGLLFPDNPFFSRFFNGIFSYAGLGLITYAAYRIVPVNAPRRSAAIKGTLVCLAIYWVVSLGFRLFINPTRYNFLYGALGSLIMLLANVYFFFLAFFYGAQMSFVIDSFDALLFSKLRQVLLGERAPAGKKVKKNRFERRLFNSARGPLKKYLRKFKQGELILTKGDKTRDVYYIISGEVAVHLDEEDCDPYTKVATIKQGSFFGEMEFLLSDSRHATIKALTDLVVMVLPPKLFDNIIKTDPGTDRQIIENLSKQLRRTNEKLVECRKGSDEITPAP
ncbi:YhjD/YihY/BrkB family envelope integrity protein [Breznakiella homolactica]|uniref:YihY/virulence factor BrkB family protein n=1 Tax=Breznakiella homolactica TaxID=2798577 RepID=A0A7T7XKE6_9SPIR|nr:YhjD/YihY/BrkB family envelope integrity protein [Breznakiella homolactica]QQO08039.1 YihY/virulence factor BrkB family protein [Breznakiella homolactica]